MKIGQKLDSKIVCDMISPNTKDDVLQCKLEGKVAQIVVDFFFSILFPFLPCVELIIIPALVSS